MFPYGRDRKTFGNATSQGAHAFSDVIRLRGYDGCRTLSADGVTSIAALISRAGLAGAQRAVVDPVDHQLSLPEVPMTVHLHELIQVPD